MRTVSKAVEERNGEKGRWTQEEHQLFLKGIEEFGKNWKKIGQVVPTRTGAQIRSHAQKYFKKLEMQAHEKCPVSENSTSQSNGAIFPLDLNFNEKAESYFISTILPNFSSCETFWSSFIHTTPTPQYLKDEETSINNNKAIPMPFKIFQKQKQIEESTQ